MKEREPFDWINEESKTFLERGYLSKGEDPIQRLQSISDHAENILGIEGYSDKFMNYLSKGWYSLSSPVWANFGKKRGLPVSWVRCQRWEEVPLDTLEPLEVEGLL